MSVLPVIVVTPVIDTSPVIVVSVLIATLFPAREVMFKSPLVVDTSLVDPLIVILPTFTFDAVIVLPTPIPPVTTSAPDVVLAESLSAEILTGLLNFVFSLKVTGPSNCDNT